MKNTVLDLITEYNKQEGPFIIHEFHKNYQCNAFKSIRDNLKKNKTFVRIDFSENYTCKLNREVHSMHFGASKVKLSLHTGVQYSKKDELVTQSFTTVSQNLEHTAPGIWAHLIPVLKKINDDKQIDTVYFGSDGPTAQYKNKFNFFL